jgi:hypothetical protein
MYLEARLAHRARRPWIRAAEAVGALRDKHQRLRAVREEMEKARL